jgi:hypothetical protein
MNYIVLILGSTTLVAGGTAITSQQDARNNVIAHQRPYQEHRLGSPGTDCPPVETPIFGNVAHQLILENPDCWIGYLADSDVDGDGVLERAGGFCQRLDSWDKCDWYQERKVQDVKTQYVPGSNPPVVVNASFLDVHPDSMTYEGFDSDDLQYEYSIYNLGFLDVTNDGKPDAIIWTNIQTGCNGSYVTQYYYVENISEWTAACATDINNDDVTDVVDLLEVISGWGPCE